MGLFDSLFSGSSNNNSSNSNSGYADTSSIAGIQQASGGSFNSIGTTISMDLGLQPKNQAYYGAMPGRRAMAAKHAAAMGPSNKSDDGPGLSSAASRARKLTAAELRAQRKAAELAKRRTEGQAARKEFEKKKGERTLALRKRYMMLLNV